jgi:hypothetical protein
MWMEEITFGYVYIGALERLWLNFVGGLGRPRSSQGNNLYRGLVALTRVVLAPSSILQPGMASGSNLEEKSRRRCYDLCDRVSRG